MTPEKIRQLRTALGLSARELAKRVGVSHTLIGHWEKGTSAPTGELLERLELALAEAQDMPASDGNAVPAVEPVASDLLRLPLNHLRFSEDNPRQDTGPGAISTLADSIAVEGLLQNLVVRPMVAGRYEVISGNRRLEAMQHLVTLGLWDAGHLVPVRLVDVDDNRALQLALIENLQRVELNAIEEGDAFMKLREMGMDAATIADRVGRTARHVNGRIAMARDLIWEFAADLRCDEISVTEARDLARLSPERQQYLYSFRKQAHFAAALAAAVEEQRAERAAEAEEAEAAGAPENPGGTPEFSAGAPEPFAGAPEISTGAPRDLPGAPGTPELPPVYTPAEYSAAADDDQEEAVPPPAKAPPEIHHYTHDQWWSIVNALVALARLLTHNDVKAVLESPSMAGESFEATVVRRIRYLSVPVAAQRLSDLLDETERRAEAQPEEAADAA